MLSVGTFGYRVSSGGPLARKLGWERAVQAPVIALTPRYYLAEKNGENAWRRKEVKALLRFRRYQRTLENKRPRLTSREIIAGVAKEHGLRASDLTSPSRKSYVVAARHEAAYRMKVELGGSLPWIGKRLGGRDHTTILWAIQVHCARNNLRLPDGMEELRGRRLSRLDRIREANRSNNEYNSAASLYFPSGGSMPQAVDDLGITR